MRSVAVGLILMAWAGSAAAQQTTTNCTGIGNSVNCTSMTTPSLGQIVGESVREREAKDAARHRAADEREARVEELIQRQNAQDRAQQVGVLVAAGKCTEARDYALKAGELDLALKVQGLCQTGGK